MPYLIGRSSAEQTPPEEQESLKEFLGNYQSIVSNAAFNQGEMFKREDYPTVEQLKSKFRMNMYTSEVPENDFRNLISKDLADDLHNAYSRQTEVIIDRILSEQAKQLITVMESLSHCCDSDTVVDKEGNKKYMTEIVANAMQMLGSKGEGAQHAASDVSVDNIPSSDIDDVPF